MALTHAGEVHLSGSAPRLSSSQLLRAGAPLSLLSAPSFHPSREINADQLPFPFLGGFFTLLQLCHSELDECEVQIEPDLLLKLPK